MADRAADFRLDAKLRKLCADDIADMCVYERDSLDLVAGYDARVIQCLQDYRSLPWNDHHHPLMPPTVPPDTLSGNILEQSPRQSLIELLQHTVLKKSSQLGKGHILISCKPFEAL